MTSSTNLRRMPSADTNTSGFENTARVQIYWKEKSLTANTYGLLRRRAQICKPPLAGKAQVHPAVENTDSALLLSRRRKLRRLARPRGRSAAEQNAGEEEEEQEERGAWAAGSRGAELLLSKGQDRQTKIIRGGREVRAPAPSPSHPQSQGFTPNVILLNLKEVKRKVTFRLL